MKLKIKKTQVKHKSKLKICDELWAKVVKQRANGRCEYCGKEGVLAAHHIIPRTCYPVRHDVLNGVALCHPYHHLYWAHKDAVAFVEWVKTVRDLDYLELRRHSQSKNDYESIRIYLEGELK